MNRTKLGQTAILTLGMVGALASQSLANVEQFKLYKKAFPDVKMQCNYCHLDEKPKKDEGMHDLNAYGLKAKELSEDQMPATEEVYQKLGRSEDFKAEEAGEVQK